MGGVKQRTRPVCVEQDAKVVGPYRYLLVRVWDRALPLVGWVMLNPSIAGKDTDDPTVVRVMIRTRMWGFGGILIGNGHAQIATYPEDLGRDIDDPVGPDNDEYLQQISVRCPLVVCAWGSHRRMRDRGPAVYRTLRWADITTRISCLGRCQDGSPKHPLYLPYSASLTDFRL
jgi:hypothetical protein